MSIHRFLPAAAVLALFQFAPAQESLTVGQALEMAKEKNGAVRSAYLNFEVSKQSTRISRSGFLPTVTPTFSQDLSSTQVYTGTGTGNSSSSTTTAFLDLNWRLLDSGARKLGLEQAELNQEATELAALQTLRSVLFSVHVSFLDALRAQKLLAVQEENLKRAKEILEQTKIRALPPVEDIPRKDIKQAEADYQNALVSKLAAENRVATTRASLKAAIGWDQRELPPLAEPEEVRDAVNLTMQEAFTQGVATRPDLRSSRLRVQGQSLSVRAAKLDASVQYSVDASFRRGFAEDVFNRSGLFLNATMPLYDGERSKASVQLAKLQAQAQQASYEQSEREALAEIESAVTELELNARRYTAATAAFAAAQTNFEAAQEALKEGAGTLIEILTARLTLTTAESNLVEATYDQLISDVRVRLVTGQPVPGEPLAKP